MFLRASRIPLAQLSPLGFARARHGEALAIATLILIAALGGCSTLTQLLPSQRAAQQRAERMQELHLRVMRFADGYVGRVREAFSRYQAVSVDAQDRLEAQEWKVQQSNAAYTIASGANPLVNALDMVVLATLSRMVIDDAWMTQAGRERGRPLQELHATLEREAWQLLDDILNEEQKSQLRDIIARWREKHPEVTSVAFIHFMDFAAAAGVPQPKERAPGNIFSLFGLDVFSGLDPAVREIAQTRELAERAIFYLQRSPTLLDLQVERLTYEFAAMPETQGLLTDAERISRIGDASDRLVTMLPDLLARERAAAISQLLGELEQRSRSLAAANSEVRMTLEAGTDTAHALEGTLATLDRLAMRFSALRPAGRTKDAEPFNVREYAELVSEANATVRELNVLAQRLERVLPQTAGTARSAADSISGIMDRAFVQLLVLIVATFASALTATLIYRAVASRITPVVSR